MSNPLDLGQEALSAQGKIFARSATRIGRRIAYGAVAAVFLMFAAISFHGLLWAIGLDLLGLSYVASALCVLGLDLLIVIVFALLARRSIPDPVEIEARIRRDRKLIELKQAVAISALTGLVFGPAGRFTGRKVTAIIKNIFFRGK
ncbi:hypothetical protein [Gluconobacter wancherniae]|uniref:Phage holin family protein n=1 Tax=Gluconobacter wancherniae NBRC 103581 TaxID=656744 RepID=A0A511B2P7_9PROT|nr:hypothetical protein [Gluconobacter wancherniae]MBF0854853.1 hypothetical protein [Gluconobacter wancherniae]MBS1064056.1 hypothetical protein [Gluconobacter wancherniae]MBS1089484.1 hypothetical protein [Gluconobacter wancherniae]MBS1095604.1 hypothetical protein [Gluconobacter wancherniae]GBD57979.1 hypothetical protein NBRC103581_02579 [Gluconobacter wancherniae NBRC 103581]